MASDQPPIPPAPDLGPLVFAPSGEAAPGPLPSPPPPPPSPPSDDLPLAEALPVEDLTLQTPPPPPPPPPPPLHTVSIVISWLAIGAAVLFVLVGHPLIAEILQRLGVVNPRAENAPNMNLVM